MDELEQRRRELLGDSWYEQLGDEFDKPYMLELGNKVAQRRAMIPVYPNKDDVFRAFQLSSYWATKVVIIVQDPYNDGTATGVAMGVKEKMFYPKTIDILEDAIGTDLYDGFYFPPIDMSLEYLANQGVLLLNSSLTVEHKSPNSHANYGWDKFIKRAIEELNKKEFVVYLLWGSNAQSFKKYVSDAHAVLEAEHPIKHKWDKRDSWLHNRPFSKTNVLLENNKLEPIKW